MMASLPHAPDLGFAPMPAVSRILARFDRPQVESFIAVAIELLDVLDGPADPDNPDFSPCCDGKPGDAGDHERGGDEEAGAWIEWSTMHGRQKAGGQSLLAGEEDDEDGDAPEDDDHGEEDDPSGVVDEDGVNTVTERGYFGLPIGTGAGCTISDDDGYGMSGDVPTLRVVALEPNFFTDKREFLGMSNLLTSFRSGQTIRSADSGNTYCRPAGDNRALGVPV